MTRLAAKHVLVGRQRLGILNRDGLVHNGVQELLGRPAHVRRLAILEP